MDRKVILVVLIFAATIGGFILWGMQTTNDDSDVWEQQVYLEYYELRNEFCGELSGDERKCHTANFSEALNATQLAGDEIRTRYQLTEDEWKAIYQKGESNDWCYVSISANQTRNVCRYD